jgi:hypothetical protein
MNATRLLLIMIGILFSHAKTRADLKQIRFQGSIWQKNFESLNIIRPYLKAIEEIEREEIKKLNKQQERRDKIYREQLVSHIGSAVFRDFWTPRF